MHTPGPNRWGRSLAAVLLAGALAWAAVLPVLPVVAADSPEGSAAARITRLVYLAAGRVCHQRPERSFTTRGESWPVCGRCSGIYAGAALGAVAALLLPGTATGRRAVWRRRFVAAALPTAGLWSAEHVLGAGPGNLLRAAAAAPLGAVVAAALVGVLRGDLR